MTNLRKNRRGSRKGENRKGENRKTGSRKNRKAGSRKNRKAGSRKAGSRKNRRIYGGGLPSQLSLAQGEQFLSAHSRQHGGGGNYSGAGAPVGDQGLLPHDLAASARIGPTMTALHQIAGMRDPDQLPAQTGGRRKSRKGLNRRNSNRKSRINRKSRRCGWRKNRRGGGGSYPGGGAPTSMGGMLLTPSDAAKAGTGDFSVKNAFAR